MPSTIRGGDNFDSGQRLTSTASQSSTSGTSVDFTGIPNWAKRITVLLKDVSTTGASPVQIQIGSGSVQTTSYTSEAQQGGTVAAYTSGFGIEQAGAAAYSRSGVVSICLIGANSYVQSGVVAVANTYVFTSGSGVSLSGGGVSLSGALDRIRVTTVNGTDTFDGGAITVLYE